MRNLQQGKIVSCQIGDDIKLTFKPILEFLDEKQHRQTLIWKYLKGNGINVYEYLRRTGKQTVAIDLLLALREVTVTPRVGGFSR